jgi:hypothetical protein
MAQPSRGSGPAAPGGGSNLRRLSVSQDLLNILLCISENAHIFHCLSVLKELLNTVL